MKKQICSSFLTILIIIGVVMSILNFTTKAYADSGVIYGTTTPGESLLLTSWWKLNGRFLGNWDVWEPSNCAIVFEN
ncbi:MAG: hypothetical protein DRJ11_11835 [Candidatus Aminicenantes bacterium]|nr:MAG: hypothetical protein DRJ11_11835 [Candidatus Aminicenantes bacterium]